MVKQILIVAGIAVTLSAMADGRPYVAGKSPVADGVSMLPGRNFLEIEMQPNDGSRPRAPRRAVQPRPQWKRPAGQFWGSGYCIDRKEFVELFTPLVLRPYVEYTFENVSTVSGVPRWEVQYLDVEQEQYATGIFDDKDVSWSWFEGETVGAPYLSYPGFVGYPAQFDGNVLSEAKRLPVVAAKDIASAWAYGPQAVSSHYWSTYSRNLTQTYSLAAYTGLADYDGKKRGYWFGTNAAGINAAATRFEKPDMPYLLNAVYWYYQMGQDITEEVPLKAYVFKTVNPALDKSFVNSAGQTVTQEGVELGELIAIADGVIPVQEYDRNKSQNVVTFEFKNRNPVTGAETKVSLEIEDDITIVVTGFDAELKNGGYVTSAITLDDYDEGYGNLGFIGSLQMSEDGAISYDLITLSDCFSGKVPNSVVGVLADVSYPWLLKSYSEQSDDILLPNEEVIDGEKGGPEFPLFLFSSSTTEDYEYSFNGEESCDWLRIVNAGDNYEVDKDGVEYFTGETLIVFQADMNPEDVSRTCVVDIRIPAASYQITFRQGSANDNAVGIVGVDADARYFDLQGRPVANPGKGVYIVKSGSGTSKVIL